MKKQQTLSENRQFIDGQKGKDITETLRKIELLKAQIKELTETKDNLVNSVKSVGVGLYETMDMSFDVIEKKGIESIDKKLLFTLYPDVANDTRIIKYGQPSIALINVKEKQ